LKFYYIGSLQYTKTYQFTWLHGTNRVWNRPFSNYPPKPISFIQFYRTSPLPL